MIPSAYPIVGLVVCLSALAAVILAPCCRAFRHAWFLVASVIAIIYAGDKTEPPKPPPASGVTIAVLETSVSNVTLSVNATTNEIGLSCQWMARRKTTIDGEAFWGNWDPVSTVSSITSTNMTETVGGRFVNGRRDTQIMLRYGDGMLTEEVEP